MAQRLWKLGVVVASIGVLFLVVGFYGYTQVQAGENSIKAFSQAQDVELSYNDEGDLTDRGETEGAQKIMRLLKKDWDYAVKDSELDPKDPLVNTPSEYMYQMATIAYHVLHGTQKIELDKEVVYNGETFKPGTYEFDVDGRYFTDFDRQHPIEGPAREKAWSPTAHALIAQLGVGAVTASALQLGLMVSAMTMAIGAAFLVLGGGLVWAYRGMSPEVTFGG